MHLSYFIPCCIEMRAAAEQQERKTGRMGEKFFPSKRKVCMQNQWNLESKWKLGFTASGNKIESYFDWKLSYFCKKNPFVYVKRWLRFGISASRGMSHRAMFKLSGKNYLCYVSWLRMCQLFIVLTGVIFQCWIAAIWGSVQVYMTHSILYQVAFRALMILLPSWWYGKKFEEIWELSC